MYCSRSCQARANGGPKPALGYKRCGACSRTLPIDAFGKNASRASGLASACRQCTQLASRRYKLQKKYGLTLAEYDAILTAQGNGCALCGQPRLARQRALAVDHDHATGRIRGILCAPCNTLLGRVETHWQTLGCGRLSAYLGREL